MRLWEEKLFLKTKQKPVAFFRYIDDIFGVWSGSLAELNGFIQLANSIDINIKLTSVISYTSIVFLDLSIYILNSHLHYRIHFKDTNSHSILHRSSHHPKHTFKGIVYSQIRRWAQLCSMREDFNLCLQKVRPIWQSRGYTKCLSRDSKRLVLRDLNLSSEWRKGFYLCHNCPIHHHCHPCHLFHINNKSFTITGNYNCLITNVIYLIFCDKCLLFYVGQTNNFHRRISSHLSSIRAKCPILVHKHFYTQCKTSNFKFFIIDTASKKMKLTIKEANYIEAFNTR